MNMSVDTYDSGQLNNFIASSNMSLVPYKSTHHLKDSSIFIDLCIVDDNNNLLDYGQLAVPFLSAHDLINITYDIKIKRRTNRTVMCKNFKYFDEQKFVSEVDGLDWTEVMTENCIDEKVKTFNNNLIGCLDKHAPLQRVCFKNLPALWLTTQIKKAMCEQDNLRRIWRRYKNQANYERYKAMRNHV